MTRMIMVDTETLGKLPNAAILSIGAVVFDFDDREIEYEPDYQFYEICDFTKYSNIHNFTFDLDIIKFWLQQPKESVMKYLQNGLTHPVSMFLNFYTWYSKVTNSKKETPVWFRGPEFDKSILENALDMHQIGIPWTYNASRDVRTLCELGNINPKNVPHDSESHDALQDCLHQVKCCQLAYEAIVDGSAFL